MFFVVYILGYSYMSAHVDGQYQNMLQLWRQNERMLQALSWSLTVAISVVGLVYFWSLDNWSRHPYVRKLRSFSDSGDGGGWRRLASRLNAEFRAIDKFVAQTNSFTKVKDKAKQSFEDLILLFFIRWWSLKIGSSYLASGRGNLDLPINRTWARKTSLSAAATITRSLLTDT